MKAFLKKSSKFLLNLIVKSALLLLTINAFTVANIFANDNPTNKKVYFDKNTILISDGLKAVEPKVFLKSSLNILSENIYFSSLNRYFLLQSVLPKQIWGQNNLEFKEILALNRFYAGERHKSEETLTELFKNTKDGSQKAKICLNLIKISYLNNQLKNAMGFLRIAKDSLQKFYSYNQKYELLFTEAKMALTQGLTSKAENLVITRLLPMSNKVKGEHNDFNCYLFLGKIYLRANQLTPAKWFFIQANTLAINHNYVSGEIETSLLLAKTKIKVGDNAVALQDLAKAKRLIDEDHSIYLADLKELTRLAGR